MVIVELTVEVEGALRENRYAKQRMKTTSLYMLQYGAMVRKGFAGF
jgi:hypothetical protein